jgi:hypothetical protein
MKRWMRAVLRRMSGSSMSGSSRPRRSGPRRSGPRRSGPRRLCGGDGDDGQVLLLSIAYGVIALLLVTVVISASSVHIERKRLQGLADSLAADAADAIDQGAFYRGELPEPVPGAALSLTDDGVRSSVEDRLGRHRALVQRFDGLMLVDASTPDGRTAEVTLAAVAKPALISWVTAPWSDGIKLRVTARARAWGG